MSDFHMIYLLYNITRTNDMNNLKKFRPILLLVIGSVLAVSSATFAPFNLVTAAPTSIATPTATVVPYSPQGGGNTDGIVVWGTILIIIVIVAIIWHQPDWMKKYKKASK
jgi:hypothetical protein